MGVDEYAAGYDRSYEEWLAARKARIASTRQKSTVACGSTHLEYACRCLLVKGHNGLHVCHDCRGEWSD